MDAFDAARAVAWSRVPDLIDRWVEKCAAPSWDIKRAIADVYTLGDVGVYWHPELQSASLYFRGKLDKFAQDMALMTQAVCKAVGKDHVGLPLTFEGVSGGRFVKVAYSPTLRRIGELLNFFPGQYPGGYPNAPSPLAATLTGGVVGAGLGYGVGALGEHLLPARYKRGHLRNTLAALGGGVGALPGAMGMLAHHQTGQSMLSPGPLASPPDQEPRMDPQDLLASPYKEAADMDVLLGDRYQTAVEGFVKQAFSTFGMPDEDANQPPTALDVNINRLGQTLWDVGASPQTTASTMGAIYAAQQMPDPRSQFGSVTPHQTGLLGSMMGAAGGGAAGYATGFMVGKALGLLTGMPEGDQNVLKNTGAVIGIVNALVPKLFQ